MAREIYRRHSTDCDVHKLDLTPDEKRFYRDCDCPIWFHTTADDRVSFKTRDWSTAEAKLRKLNGEAKDKTLFGETIADCIDWYLASREEELGTRTLAQHRLALTRLQEFAADHHNVFLIRGLSADIIEKFRTNGFPLVKRKVGDEIVESKMTSTSRSTLEAGKGARAAC